jgi:hypothetical protein
VSPVVVVVVVVVVDEPLEEEPELQLMTARVATTAAVRSRVRETYGAKDIR